MRYLTRLISVLALLLAATLFSTPARAQEHVVEIRDFTFSPSNLTVNVGDTVTWTNAGPSPHSATASDGSFDSGNLNPGQSYTFTFHTPGTYPYVCQYHAGMHGTIIVQ